VVTLFLIVVIAAGISGEKKKKSRKGREIITLA